jgi:hypothetical protein
MESLPELRLGICECTQFFHNEFNGFRIELPGLHVLHTVKEVKISEGIGVGNTSQYSALKRSRCHYFLDAHKSSPYHGKYNVSLILCELVPGGNRGNDKLYGGCQPGKSHLTRICRWENQQIVVTNPKSSNLKDEILQGMVTLWGMLSEEWRLKYLKNMTPPGWELAKAA